MKRWMRLVCVVLCSVLFLDLVLLGVCGVYDGVIGDGHISKIAAISDRPTLAAAATRSLAGVDIYPAQKLVKQLNSEASDWLDNLKHSNKIIVSYHTQPQCDAMFDFVTRKLTLYPRFFWNCDGEKAAILLHEYRHSRQNYAKIVLLVHACLWRIPDAEQIVERDAVNYEIAAFLALGMHDKALSLASR